MKPRRLLINVLTALPVAAAIVAMCFAPDSVFDLRPGRGRVWVSAGFFLLTRGFFRFRMI